MRGAGRPGAAPVDRAGRAISGPSTFALYTVGTVKPVELDGGASRLYVAVDGGMSDNIRTALYAAEYSATLASRDSYAPPVLARVVGKHCEGGDILVRDEFLPADIDLAIWSRCPASGAYSRSMASNYNHVPRPPVVAVRDGRITTLLRRETIEDLLALDLGWPVGNNESAAEAGAVALPVELRAEGDTDERSVDGAVGRRSLRGARYGSPCSAAARWGRRSPG